MHATDGLPVAIATSEGCRSRTRSAPLTDTWWSVSVGAGVRRLGALLAPLKVPLGPEREKPSDRKEQYRPSTERVKGQALFVQASRLPQPTQIGRGSSSGLAGARRGREDRRGIRRSPRSGASCLGYYANPANMNGGVLCNAAGRFSIKSLLTRNEIEQVAVSPPNAFESSEPGPAP